MAPLVSLLASALSLLPRAPSAFPPYITTKAEPMAYCRRYADDVSDVVWSIQGENVNITCWTESTMKGTEKGRSYDGDSYIWAWVAIPEGKTIEPTGLSTVAQDLQPTKRGCWVNEHQLQLANVDLKKSLAFFKAPHHQVGAPKNNTDFKCRECTDLKDEKCKKTIATYLYGYVDIGCWKKGSSVGGNSTWVKLVESGFDNCWISPDQFHPKEWYGNPDVECKK